VWKSIGVLAMFVLAAIMRKMGARLVQSTTRVDQLTLAQKVLLATYTVVAVLTLAIPGFPVVSAAVEMCVWVLVVLSVWWDFMKFVLASNEAFGLLAKRLSCKKKSETLGQVGIAQSLQGKKAARQVAIAKSLKRSMMALLLIVHILFLGYVLVSSFWPINLPGICDARSVDKDARHIIETVRFYVGDVLHVVIAISLWANIYVFTGAARRKKKNPRRYQAAIAPPSTGYVNATSVVATET
jgi:hypothetical protein